MACREPPAPSPGPLAGTVARPRGAYRGAEVGSGHRVWVCGAVWTQVECRNVLGGSLWDEELAGPDFPL